MNPNTWGRWPLLLGAVVCLAVAVTLFTQVQTAEGRVLAAFALVVLGSVLLGAFVYSEGAGNTNKKELVTDLEAPPPADPLARYFEPSTPPPAEAPKMGATGPDNLTPRYAGQPIDPGTVYRP